MYSATNRSTVSVQLNWVATSRLRRLKQRRSSPSLRSRPIRSAYWAGSCETRVNPVRPSFTMVGTPPTRAATTGVPQALASSATRPNDSLYEGTTHTAARLR